MNRVEELNSYKILDTAPEKELDDLAAIAAAIFNVPVSIISFIDDERQWYKAKIGVDFDEVPLEDTFCQQTLEAPEEILVVENPSSDKRFKSLPMVLLEPGVKFYVGAPLVSKTGQVMGTLCVLDYKKRKSRHDQIDAIKILSGKIMEYVEMRKIINSQSGELIANAVRLKRLTDLSPGIIFKIECQDKNDLKTLFISEGANRLLPEVNSSKLMDSPTHLIDYIHPKDRFRFIRRFKASLCGEKYLDVEYRIVHQDQSVSWHWLKANSEKDEKNKIVLHGIIQNITQKRNHFDALKKMLFDISHVIRKPIANMMGLVEILKYARFSETDSTDYLDLIENCTNELDDYVQVLNKEYTQLQSNLRKGENNPN